MAIGLTLPHKVRTVGWVFFISIFFPILSFAAEVQSKFYGYDNLSLLCDDKPVKITFLKDAASAREAFFAGNTKASGVITGNGVYDDVPVSSYFECLVKEGFLDGECKIYEDNGTVKRLVSVQSFEKGKPHGLYQLFNPFGVVILEENYVNGVLDGFSRVYFVEMLTVEKEFKKGELVRQTAYNFNGDIIYKVQLKNSVAIEIECFSPRYKEDNLSRILKGDELKDFKPSENCYSQ